MADPATLQLMANASYNASAPQTLNGWQLVGQTPTLKFYKKDFTIIVAIRGTADANDVKADGLLALGKLETSSRYNADLQTLQQIRIVYPSPPYTYMGVGHSLGGAILDSFLKRGLISSGTSYNPAIQPEDIRAELPNRRIYTKSDPLYKLMGQHAKNVEVRDQRGRSIWGNFLRQIPYLGALYDAYTSHQLSNFFGGTHREDFLTNKGLNPSERYSLATLAKVSGVPRKILQEVYNRGIGAYRTQGTSVRLKGSYVKNVKAPMKKKLSKEQWAWGRVYSFLNGNPKHDNDLRANKAKIGGGKESFQQYLEGIGYSPSAYLKEARRRAKAHGYKNIEFSDDGEHKLVATSPEGKATRFGRVGYGDHLIWSHLERKGKAPPGKAEKKRQVFHKSHEKIKGNWKADPYSANNLALRVLW